MWHILSFVLGAIIGSFLNVVIYRLPRDDLKLWDPPRSFCPNCGHPLSWKDNIPILSYIILKGRCRYCGWRIPFRYFFVEVSNSTFYLLSSFFIGDTLLLLAVWSVFSTLLAISFIDLETMTISDSMNLIVLISSLVISWRLDRLIWGLIVGGSVFGIFLLVAWLSRGFGMGDVFLIGASSVAMEPLSINIAILVSALSGLVYAAVKNKGLRMKEKVPFGPFLSIGIIVGILHTIWIRGMITW